MTNFKDEKETKFSKSMNIDSTDRNPYNVPKRKVPEDLQSLIISNNPQHNIQFTYSYRMNTQMVVSGYLLNKKRGPYTTASSGLRTISWKCTMGGCPYYILTLEGTLKDSEVRQHNHEKQPELFTKKEARYKLIKKIAEQGVGSGTPVSHFVLDTVKQETEPDILEKIGSLDALKQAARRYKRKLKQKDELVENYVVKEVAEEEVVEDEMAEPELEESS